MGEPDSPRVVMDNRRWLAWGLVGWVVEGLLCLVKRSAIDPRRGRLSDSGTVIGEVERSLDMAKRSQGGKGR